MAAAEVGREPCWFRRVKWSLVSLLACSSLFAAPVAHAGTIASENALPGTKAWQPLFNNAPAGAIEGYTGQVSYQSGDTLDFHVSTNPAASYRIVIYRLGYYQGLGGRQIALLPASNGAAQPVPAPDPYGRVAAGWPVTDSFTVPSSWVSGSYVAKLVLTSGASIGKSAPVPFIIRSTAPAPMLIVSSVNTAEAYNSWGGKSLYSFNSSGGVAAVKVSFDRPYSSNVLFFEQPFVSWFEKQGIDASYTTDVDVDADPSQLLAEHFVLVSDHSEYWSKADRDAYEAARAAGVNLAFWGGDQGTWQVRYEDSRRTLVGYKLNPGDPYANTIYASTSFPAINRPECQLLGTSFTGAGQGYIPSYTANPTDLNDPWFAGTGLSAGMTVVGNNFEYDSQAPAGCLAVPSTTLFYWSGQPQNAPAVRYQWPSGSTVFSVGSFALSMVGTSAPMRQLALNAITSLAGTASAPANQTLPSITGTASVGQTLTLNPGTWAGTPTPTLAVQWQDCDATGNNCVPISGASGARYTVTSADTGFFTINATVTATNTAGTASATSTPTAIVANVPSLAPTTPVLDNFNRSNGPAGPNWSLLRPTGVTAMKISNNAAVDSSTSAFAWDYWNPSPFGPDSEAYATITAWGTSDTIRIGARITGAGTTSASGYFVAISSTGSWSILRIDHGPSTTLATGPTQPVAAGDQIGIRIVGATITALHWTPNGGWVQVLIYDTSTDTTRYTAPGYLAIEFKTSTIDNFGGGSI